MLQPFDPLEYLAFAQEITNQRREEVRLRTAINRAYYAVYLIAREKTHPKKVSVPHGDVIKGIRKRNPAIGDKLSSLYRFRATADYQLMPKEPDKRNWEQNWSTVQSIVGDILQRLQAL